MFSSNSVAHYYNKTIILTAMAVMDDFEKSLSASLNLRLRLSELGFVSLLVDVR